MNIKKISAAIITAAVLAVAAPMTGVLPDPLGVVASAASPDPVQTEYKAGDFFGVAMNPETGETFGEATDVMSAHQISSEEFGNGAVYDCQVLDDGTIRVYTYCMGNEFIHQGKKITIPSEICGYTVTEIGGIGEDSHCVGGFSSITIPDTVKTINPSAFAFNFYLEEINFGANSRLKLIDSWAFQDCRSLKSVSIPAGVETIATGAFGNTDKEFSSKLIGKDFTNIYSLTSVNFASNSTLKLIDQWAFQRQTALKSITLPDSLEKIGGGAFINCSGLTEITIPANVNEVVGSAFSCTGNNIMNISKIEVDPNNKNYKSVDGILFSKDGKTIVRYPAAKNGGYAVPADVNTIGGGAFAHSTKLTSVTISEGVTDIPENAFTYCTSLAEVKLPSTLKTIGKWGFEACAFTSLDIPESVTSIDTHAFDSTPLKTISGIAGSYAETFAKENGYTFNNGSSEQPSKPDDTSKPTDTPTTFTDDSGEKAADIEVIAKPNVIPKEAHFSVRLDDKNTTAERIAYNCYFTYNGAEYEPTDTVTVRIPVPVAMRDIADTLKVYHLQDGKYVNMSAKVENGYLVFDTDHFSVYVVTAENLENGGTSTPTTSDTTSSTPTASDTSSSAPTSSDTASSAPTTSDKGNPDTGVTAIAVTAGAVALAGAIVLIAHKKRK